MTGHPTPRRSPARPDLPPHRRLTHNALPVLTSLLVMVLLLATAVVVAGCGSGEETTTTAGSTSTSAPTGSTTGGTAAPSDTTVPTTGQASEGIFPVNVKDDNGNTVTIDSRPERIVSTAPASTEILFAIGAGDRVVGVNSLDDYPPEVADIAKVGDFQLNTEAIMSLSPDLVLGYSGLSAEEALEPVKQAGAPILLFGPATVDGVYTNIITVGAATGNVEQAAALIDSLKTQIKQMSDAAAAAGSAPKVFYAVDNTLWTVGTGTFVDDLLKLANAVNVASRTADDPATQGYYQFAPEQLIAADPDVILLPNTAFKSVEEFTKDPRFAQLSAIKNGQVYLIDDVIVTRPGPRIAEGLQTLVEVLHPEAM